MTLRLDYRTAAPDAYRALRALHDYTRAAGLAPRLLHLIDVRASQINGCAFCLDMHTREALADGETPQRLFTLDAWRETPFFSPEERAVLALTESVTRVADGGVPDSVYAEVERHFAPAQIVALLLAINSINSWNRVAIATGMQPKPAAPPAGEGGVR